MVAVTTAGLPTTTRDAIARVPRQLAYRLDALPLEITDGVLTVALPPGDAAEAHELLGHATRLTVNSVTMPREAIRDGLREAYDPGASARRSNEAPAIRALNALHERAIEAHASDIHLEPRGTGGVVRLRIDGLLREIDALPEGLFVPVVSRVKLLAGMDIADRRQPQDGRYAIERVGRELDARVSSMPTIDGEKLVIRLLDPAALSPRLDSLGMEPALLNRFRRAIGAPYGFVVVTGPTGSGKTTTLYGALGEIGADVRSVCSVEDPVEMRIAGVSQVHVNVRAGLTFPTVLRSFLRQDPNVIMIGEMRDAETAAVGVSAALSGQLILTTLHSSDAPRAIERLLELGITRHAIASGLSAVVSQRLVRIPCASCRRPSEVPADFGASLPTALTRAWTAAGCQACDFTGYRGRCGIFELLEIGDAVRDAIASGASPVAIGELGRASGYVPLLTAGLAKVATGQTTLDELSRVVTWMA